MTPMTETDAALDARVAGLAAMVARQLDSAMAALHAADLGVADAVVRGDAEVNRTRYDIEQAVSRELLAGAGDEARLRLLLTVLHVVGDLERIGDHAEGIAKVALMLGSPSPLAIPATLTKLGEMSSAMFRDGVAAYASRDVDAARALCAHDDVIDDHYDQVYGEQLLLMAESVDDVTLRTYLLWVAHNLERVADRVTNICERTVYLVTGSIEELNVSNY